jgi:hypothetical protein
MENFLHPSPEKNRYQHKIEQATKLDYNVNPFCLDKKCYWIFPELFKFESCSTQY